MLTLTVTIAIILLQSALCTKIPNQSPAPSRAEQKQQEQLDPKSTIILSRGIVPNMKALALKERSWLVHLHRLTSKNKDLLPDNKEMQRLYVSARKPPIFVIGTMKGWLFIHN